MDKNCKEKNGKLGSNFFRNKAEECVKTFDIAKLDYTTDSLKRLDNLIDKNWSKDRFDKAEFGETDNFDNMAFTGLVLIIGSYFGETLIKNLNGNWEKREDMGWVVDIKGKKVNAFHIAQDCFREPSKFHFIYEIVTKKSSFNKK